MFYFYLHAIWWLGGESFPSGRRFLVDVVAVIQPGLYLGLQLWSISNRTYHLKAAMGQHVFVLQMYGLRLDMTIFFHKFSFISHGCSRCSSKSSRDHDFVLKRLRMVTTGDLPWLVSTTCGLRCCSSFIIPDMLNVHSLRTGNSSSSIGKSAIRCNVQ